MSDSTQQTDVSPWDSVPNEIALKIFSHFEVKDLVQTSLVSRRFNELSDKLIRETKYVNLSNTGRSHDETVSRINDIFLDFPLLETVTFSGFSSETQLELLRKLDATCKNVNKIHISNTVMCSSAILLIHQQLLSLRKINLTIQTHEPPYKCARYLTIVDEGHETRFPKPPTENNERFWIFEIPAYGPDNCLRRVYYRYRHKKDDIYHATVYECINKQTYKECFIGEITETRFGKKKSKKSIPKYCRKNNIFREDGKRNCNKIVREMSLCTVNNRLIENPFPSELCNQSPLGLNESWERTARAMRNARRR